MDNDNILHKRFLELSGRSMARCCYTNTEFLTMAEQSELLAMGNSGALSPFRLEGGYSGAERKLALFGCEDICGYESQAPIVCIRISPKQEKFADVLSHRDYLGSLMALGIRRETLGDIVPSGKTAYLFCLDTIAPYIISELEQVRHTSVTCEICDAPEICTAFPDESRINIASQRLDVIIAAVYKLSRSAALELFAAEKVFADSRLVSSAAFIPSEGSVISVRGCGRFIFEGLDGSTRKGRLWARVRIY